MEVLAAVDFFTVEVWTPKRTVVTAESMPSCRRFVQ